jgi:uncharacterized membrane protein
MDRWTRHRVVAVDAARGVALLGMMAVHIVPALRPDGSVAPAFLLAAGRASALFAVLAGVGLALLSGGSRPVAGAAMTRVRVAVLARAALLVAIGLGLGTLDSGVAVILVYYGVFFVLVVPFLGLRPVTLAWLAAITAVAAPVLSHAVRASLAPPSYAVPTPDFFAQPWPDWLTELTLTGYYPAVPWMAYLFTGLALGRLVLTERVLAGRLLVGGLALAVGARLLSALLLGPLGGLAVLTSEQPELFGLPLTTALRTGLFGTTPTGSWWWLAVASPHTATPLDLAATIGSSLAVLGFFLLVLPRPSWWAEPLVAIGGMTLTLYTLHVLLLAGPLPGSVPLSYLWHVLVLATLAVLWRRFVGQGPLEWLTQRASTRLAAALVPAPATAAPERGDATR